MNANELFDRLLQSLDNKFNFLEDKPEETLDSTLRALWFAAYGIQKSVQEAVKSKLPELSEQQVAILQGLIEHRLNNTPLAHITGRQSFMDIELLSDKRALIPRKETEILGQKALDLSLSIALGKNQIKVIDVCCGAGNLGLALAYYNSNAVVYATDLSNEAVDLTQDNIKFIELSDRVYAFQGDLFEAFEKEEYYKSIDLIVCNPPYISSAKVQKMTSEISENEPLLAFDGGMLGTKIILKLISEAPKFLKKAGWLIFEIGLGQGQFILQLCERSNFYDKVESVSDVSGNIRVILARKQ